MLQADIGRVNARAGEERRIIPERDEKTLMQVDGLIVGVTLRPSLSVFITNDLMYDQPCGRPQSNIRQRGPQSPKVVYEGACLDAAIKITSHCPRLPSS